MPSAVRITDGSWDFSRGVDAGRVSTIQSQNNPNGLPRNALAWLNNGTVRGGGITQRATWQPLCTVHDGSALYQGGFLYEPDEANPYLMLSIGGSIYQVRVDTNNSVHLLSGALTSNSFISDQSFFVQAESFLVIQSGDGVTLPLFWDGVILRRSLGINDRSLVPGHVIFNGVNEIPAATAMDYFMGRLWYAQGRQYSAGDIVRGPSGSAPYDFRDSVLNITENPLVLGGDGFTVPTNAGNIRAIKHTAELDTSLGQGQLYIGTRRSIYRLTVPVSRTQWSDPAFAINQPLQVVVQNKFGFINDRSVVASNADLFYQAMDGVRSMALALRYFQQWGNTPISRNENRALQFNDRALMRFCSGIEFDNRMLQTALPVRTPVGAAFQIVLPLDFDLITSLQDKLPPAWEGMHEGLDILQLFEGDFGGLQRAFAVVHSRMDGSIQVWELTSQGRFEDGDKRVTWNFETPAFTWGKEFELKELDGAEIWLDKIFGTVSLDFYYRPDADACYYFWHHRECCAATSHCDYLFEQDCYPIQPYPAQPFGEGQKFPIVLPKPLAGCNSMNMRPTNIGYQFQVKVVIKGFCRVRGLVLHALPKERQPFQGVIC